MFKGAVFYPNPLFFQILTNRVSSIDNELRFLRYDIGKEDQMPLFGREAYLEVFERLKCQKEFYEIDGWHFWALWPQSPLFYEAISKKITFIKSIN